MASAMLSSTVVVSFLLVLSTICGADLSSQYYVTSCPQVVGIVKSEVAKILQGNPNLAGGFQRLHFHDCWVNGCDGSVTIKSTASNQAEPDAFVNFMLRAIPEIDQIKAAVEAQCPDTVSCADIIALAARDATVSNFAAKGFSAREMIVLSGSHTIGRTHCNGIGPNLYNYTGIDDLTNPNLDPTFAANLKQECPKGNRDNVVNMDSTPNTFDRQYLEKVLANQ
ncbi:hypothetical protein R1flu_004011 [Riccia fluitans]|uniref:Plant heme peroxidase family profile domain-containing protein n=1 Tax=Riccia fluitans TaxID=41844 RepID=A0ABD1YS37_9MARC